MHQAKVHAPHPRTIGVFPDDATEFPCSQCNRVFTIRDSYLKHNTMTQKRKCPDCGQTFCRQLSLYKHRKSAHGVKNFKCPSPKCDYVTHTKNGLRYHFLRRHDTDPKIPCPKCPLKFPLNAVLREHLIQKHGEQRKLYLCALCGKEFQTNSGLSLHKSSIHLKKLLPCDLCDKSFRR